MTAIAVLVVGALWGIVPELPIAAGGRPAGALTLREAVAQALDASPALQPSQDAVEMAAIGERLELSRFGVQLAPVLQLGTMQSGMRQQQAGLVVSRRLPTGTDLMVSADWMQFGFGGAAHRDAGMTLGASQSVLQAFGPAPRAGLTAARRASASASRAAAAARQQLVLRTASAYFAIVRHELLTEAAGQARHRGERLRAAAEARARAGLATQLDVMRAELLVAQADASWAGAREALERARDDLKILLGRAVDSDIAIDSAEVPDTVGPPPPDVAALQRAAFAGRLDLQESRDRIEDAARAEAVARWTALPDVQVTASYTRRGLAGDAGSGFNDLLGGWRVGVTTTYGVQRAAASAAAASAAIGVRAAERAAFDREQAAAAEIRGAHRAVVRSAGAIDIQRKAMAIAERQARLAALRHERGLADNVDVIDAEMNLLQARTALIGARVDHALARLTLDHVTGMLNPDGYLK